MITSLLSATNPANGVRTSISVSGFSVLTRNFNMLYAQALNQRANGTTHFCMHHEDIIPDKFWLDRMLAIMKERDADILSVVAPLKDNRGLTSTGIDEPLPGHVEGWEFKRLTLTEIYNDYPATFTHPKLLINTGLMLVKLTQPWCEKLHFEFTDAIIPNPKEPGKFMPVGVSEDWNFSRMAHKLGLKVYATREIPLLHFGQGKFSNGKWGTMTVDTATGK